MWRTGCRWRENRKGHRADMVRHAIHGQSGKWEDSIAGIVRRSMYRWKNALLILVDSVSCLTGYFERWRGCQVHVGDYDFFFCQKDRSDLEVQPV